MFAIASGTPACPTAYDASKGIEAVIDTIGAGTVYSVCDADQSQNLQALGQDILEKTRLLGY